LPRDGEIAFCVGNLESHGLHCKKYKYQSFHDNGESNQKAQRTIEKMYYVRSDNL
jgi:hypothetical protein